MNDLLWNGKLDYGWTDLSNFLRDCSHSFVEGMLNTVQFSPNSESKELISHKCMERFESIVGILANIIKDIQANRNGIHSFQQREIGNWNDLQYSIRFFCYLLDWVCYHLPDIPDYD